MILTLIMGYFQFVFALAQPQLTASLSEPKVRPGEYVELTLSVNSEEDIDVDPPTWTPPSGIENEGMQTQTSIQSQLMPGPNGMQFTKKKSLNFIYHLKAVKEGKYSLGPFSFSINGQNLKLGAIEFLVSKSAPAPSIKDKGRGYFPPGFEEDEMDGLLGQLLKRQPRQDPQDIPSRKLPVNEKEAFFVILEADKKEAFEGEQIFASWYIYTRGQIHQFDRLKFPTLRGFWKEDVEPAPNLNFEREQVNGVLFQRALLASYAIFPIKAGLGVIDEYKVKAVVSLPSSNRGLFGNFGYGQPYTYTRTSQPLKINIKPLPMEGRPLTFSGAVGNFKIESHVDNQNFVQGQPFNLKLRIEGEGNAKLIDLPKIEWPSQFELYDSKSESRFFQSGKSYKEFSLLLIPKESGILKIPPIEFSYFDPLTATYKTTQTQEVALQVTPGDGTIKSPSSRMKLEDSTKEIKGPQLPLPELISKQNANSISWSWLSGSPMFYAWSVSYLILIGIFFLVNWLWLKRLYSRRTLKDELKDRRMKCEKLSHKNQLALASTEVINAIYYLLSRLVDEGELSRDLSTLLEQLPPSIRHEISDSLQKELELLQAVAFAPEDVWKSMNRSTEFNKHSDQVFEILDKTLRLSEEGA